MKYQIKDNLFKAINNEWLEKTEIPSDRTSIGEFVELDIKNELIVKKIVKNLVKKQKEWFINRY